MKMNKTKTNKKQLDNNIKLHIQEMNDKLLSLIPSYTCSSCLLFLYVT